MTRYETLKKSAQQSAKYRGHALSQFAYMLQPNRMVGRATCVKCGADVVINTNPLPNDIDISGEAVALNCQDSAANQSSQGS